MTRDDDLARIEQQVGPITGTARQEVVVALDENREGVLALAERISRRRDVKNPAGVSIVAIRSGEHKRRLRVMDEQEGTGPKRPQRVPAAEAMRRLYDAKMGDLARYRMPEGDRIRLAVDYACGEVHRCSIEPMPPGGVVALEDELYRSVGFDRATGVRFPPA